MKIYTRSGDQGQTSLFGGQRVSKADLRVEAYGTVDELNAAIGLAESLIDDSGISSQLQAVQSRLFGLGSDLATPRASGSERTASHVQRVQEAWAKGLEDAIDQAESEIEALSSFILPGGTPGAAALQVARTVCRRAERRVVTLSQEEDVTPAVLIYLNRLADLLFVLARLANQRAGIAETPWSSYLNRAAS
ncbi:MAG: Cob(I)yrinic acid a,c-diamide adenosyltransferase [Anaerolineales bacterium]|nr:Cob(I)yrinic acid a,c-diamide adenosyltransferase [Anaerolineales bacterium]